MRSGRGDSFSAATISTIAFANTSEPPPGALCTTSSASWAASGPAALAPTASPSRSAALAGNSRLGDAEFALQLVGHRLRVGARGEPADAQDVGDLLAFLARQDLRRVAGAPQLV